MNDKQQGTTIAANEMMKKQGASRCYDFLFPPLITIAANSNCSFSCLAGQQKLSSNAVDILLQRGLRGCGASDAKAVVVLDRRY